MLKVILKIHLFSSLTIQQLIVKVLFITHYSELYGANKSLLDLLVGLKQFPLEPIVLLPHEGEMCHKLDEIGVKRIVYSFKNPFVYRWRSKNKLFKFFHDGRFLILGIYNQIINCIIIKKIKCHKYISDISLIYSNASVMTIGEDLSKKLKVPHIHQIRELATKLSLLPSLGLKWYERKIKNSELIIFNSCFTQKQFTSNYILSNTLVIYNEIRKPEIVQPIILEKNHFKIGIFGYLSSQKNQIEALTATSLIDKSKDIKLYLVGGGSSEKLIDYVDSLSINNRVQFVGYTNNIGAYYDEMDIVIVCSKNEALGRVTVEAMLSSKCVIGKNSGATAEIIDHNVNGLLYNTVYELAHNIEFLYENPTKRHEMAENGYKNAVTKFASGSSIKSIYNEIIKLI
ncbi:MAG: glycosyltransferase family 4 protein [Cyclobacteriaceae bacterium]|nr:glycosyltransferase family 4 protein [Cyclobacteriaceae bacterium]